MVAKFEKETKSDAVDDLMPDDEEEEKKAMPNATPGARKSDMNAGILDKYVG